jgi:hypothetical protein
MVRVHEACVWIVGPCTVDPWVRGSVLSVLSVELVLGFVGADMVQQGLGEWAAGPPHSAL